MYIRFDLHSDNLIAALLEAIAIGTTTVGLFTRASRVLGASGALGAAAAPLFLRRNGWG